MTEGLVLVDKPAGWTSHDVVARIRRLAGTRRVGHAGTLDPMATGLLIVGVERATRLLGHLALHDKDYLASIRLGVTTVTDDAEGEVVDVVDASAVSDASLATAMAALTGELMQVPSSVSAIKVDGKRAYARTRAGESVELAARPVHVERFDLLARRGDELDVAVTCSTGTYVRALARDLGASLGVGAHLTALRRTRIGGFRIDDAATLDHLATQFEVIPLDAALRATFPVRLLTDDEVFRVARGQRIEDAEMPAGPVAAFGPDGSAVALLEQQDGRVRSLVVFAPAT
ncbi:MAG: tRNA pseudouridine55 synthase [Frankiaceae bacterium]|nr:tRNA pseudouridine55 synthase [Frankiaceae bacterium]